MYRKELDKGCDVRDTTDNSSKRDIQYEISGRASTKYTPHARVMILKFISGDMNFRAATYRDRTHHTVDVITSFTQTKTYYSEVSINHNEVRSSFNDIEMTIRYQL